MKDQVRVVFIKVVEKDRDPETDMAHQVALVVSGAEEKSLDLVVVTDLRPIRICFLEGVAADVALRSVFILFPLLGTHALHRSICPKLHHDRRHQFDEHVQELSERILPDIHHGQLIVLAESQAKDCRCGAHFLLLGISSLLC